MPYKLIVWFVAWVVAGMVVSALFSANPPTEFVGMVTVLAMLLVGAAGVAWLYDDWRYGDKPKR